LGGIKGVHLINAMSEAIQFPAVFVVVRISKAN